MEKEVELSGQSKECVFDVPVPYTIDLLKDVITTSIIAQLPQGNKSPVELKIVESPARTGFDYGINLSSVPGFATIMASDIDTKNIDFVDEVKAVGPFINFKLDMAEYGSKVLSQISEMGPDYGKENEGKGKRVVIDMSSPNIAKRMNYGHLRSTIIGDSLASIYKSQGYEVIRDNHVGDWGTQFGKMIVAIKKWGNEEDILSSKDPIGTLQELYVKFEKEATDEKEHLREDAKKEVEKGGYGSVPGLASAVEAVSKELMKRKEIKRSELKMDTVLEDALDRVIESDLEKQGRAWFLKLEKGDSEARRLWKLCVDLSMKEFNQIYKTLGVDFEKTLGESFYEDQLVNVVDIVEKGNVGKISDGALVVDMTPKGLGVAIIRKSDGASVYMTRDIACAIYRQEKMGAEKAIYVVGDDQKYYFRQLFEILKRLDYKIGDNAEHVYFGMVSLPEGKMSTRKGRVILLKDVVDEGVKRTRAIIKAKNPEIYKDVKLRNKIVRQIAIGALKWNDLSQDAKKSIVFDWGKALNLEGNSAPYVQYTAVRANSILMSSVIKVDKAENISKDKDVVYKEVSERALIRQLSEFPNAIREAKRVNSPTKIATYVYELAKKFNSFYTKLPVIKAENKDVVESRLNLTAATAQVITNALALLGIEVPERM